MQLTINNEQLTISFVGLFGVDCWDMQAAALPFVISLCSVFRV